MGACDPKHQAGSDHIASDRKPGVCQRTLASSVRKSGRSCRSISARPPTGPTGLPTGQLSEGRRVAQSPSEKTGSGYRARLGDRPGPRPSALQSP